VPEQLPAVWALTLPSEPEGPSLISCAAAMSVRSVDLPFMPSRRTISCEAPLCSCVVSFNSLFGGIAFCARPKGKTIAVSCSHVLIDEDQISIWVHNDEAGRPRGALVCLLLQLHPLGS
jgi:hypothetical protein